jgi:hypothetical protein
MADAASALDAAAKAIRDAGVQQAEAQARREAEQKRREAERAALDALPKVKGRPFQIRSAEDIPAKLSVDISVFVEETGQTDKVSVNARRAYRDADKRVNRLQALMECMR